MITSHFSNIRQKIKEELSRANSEILVAVYWFTNEELFNRLLAKQKQGVRVKLIVHNDFINNRETGLNFQSLINNGGDFYFSYAENPMHNKFCIIDGKVVINGSYNWTYYAEERNYENVTIIEDTQLADNFSKAFNSIRNNLKRVEKVDIPTWHEIDDFSESTKTYLANDLLAQAKVTNNTDLVNAAFAVAPNNLQIQDAAVKFKLTDANSLGLSVGIGLHQNEYLVGIKKGTVVPYIYRHTITTVENDQKSCECKIYFGDNPHATSNKLIGSVRLNRIPSLPQGIAKIQVTFSIDLYGSLKVTIRSLDNGYSDFFNYSNKSLLTPATN